MKCFTNLYIKSLILLLTIVIEVNSLRQQSGLLQQKFCTIQNQNAYIGHFNLIQIKCKWQKFLNYLQENKNLTVNKSDLYEFVFERESPYSVPMETNVYEIKSNLFEKFKIRKLVLNDLEIKTINIDAFKDCCEQTLEHLDLSKNKLRRIDRNILSNLKVLDHLNLSSNEELQINDENFRDNIYLKYIGLASNGLEYLPDKLFFNLNYIEKLDLSNNNLRNLDACTFYSIYKDLDEPEKKISKVYINATVNKIQCNCDIFFLRAANIVLDLVCIGEPYYYHNKHINDLAKENPNNKDCYYKDIDFSCKAKYNDPTNLLKKYELIKVLVIIFACLFFFTFFISICLCCCKQAKSRKYNETTFQSNNNNNNKLYSLVNKTAEYKQLKPMND